MDLTCHNLLVLALLFLSPLLLVILSRRRRLKSGGIKLPPAPFAWPIVGNLFNLDAKKPHIALTNLSKSLGPLFSLRFGSKIVVVVSSPEAARQVYKFHDKELSGRFLPMLCTKIPGVKNSTIAMTEECDQEWRSLRTMSHTQLFSSEALESHSYLRIQKVREMVHHLSSKEGEVVKIADIFFATMVNSLSMAMTSQDLIPNWDNIGETKTCMRKLLSLPTPGIGDLYPLLAGVDFGANRKAKRYIDLCTSLWGNILAERKCQGQRIPDLLDSLIKNSWDEMQIFNHLTEFLASVETMTTVTEWAIAELTRSSEALAKLRAELDEAIGECKVLQERDITKLPFLQACIKETFRLHPPIPLLVPRVAVQTCKVMNYDIPKGSLVLTNAYAPGRDPMTWEDPSSFKPERFFGKSLDVKEPTTNFCHLAVAGGFVLDTLLLSSIFNSFLPPRCKHLIGPFRAKSTKPMLTWAKSSILLICKRRSLCY